jgi:predicted TIM-barrel fold metal-dependent hydrolase
MKNYKALFKSDSIRSSLESMGSSLKELSTSSEDVFNIIDKAYKNKFVLTPLMIDLTYVDDNNSTLEQNKKNKKQVLNQLIKIREALRLIERLSIKKENRDLLHEIRDGIQSQIKATRKAPAWDLNFFPERSFIQQIDELENLSEKYENVKPFFGVDPRREYKGYENLLGLVKQKLLGSNPAFAGIKLYAPTGFSPTDPVLMGKKNQKGIYQFCQENNIPVTVHCSDSGFACFSRQVRVNGFVNLNNQLIKFKNQILTFRESTISLDASDAIAQRASVLNHPSIWRKVLEKYPELTINFAHFGGSTPLMQFVEYIIPDNLHSMREELFDYEILNRVSDTNKTFVKNCYTKKGKIMTINESMVFEERKKLWIVFYNEKIIDNWSKAILDMIREPAFKNAYTDLSCFSAGDPVLRTENGGEKEVFTIEQKLKKFKGNIFDQLPKEVQSKFLYGSDFFFIELFGPKLEHYIRDFKEVFADDFKTIASENPERFLGIKND